MRVYMRVSRYITIFMIMFQMQNRRNIKHKSNIKICIFILPCIIFDYN